MKHTILDKQKGRTMFFANVSLFEILFTIVSNVQLFEPLIPCDQQLII
jgi:hypothetical protein